LKPDCFSHFRRRSAGRSGITRSKTHDAITVRMIKPNLIFSHDWHVQPNCQRSLKALRLSGAFFGSRLGIYSKLSSNLLR